MEELHRYGITRIYSPDDGRSMGLQGMINDLVMNSDFPTGILQGNETDALSVHHHKTIARLISSAENNPSEFQKYFKKIHEKANSGNHPVLGITGTGGAGKSSLVDDW